MSDEKVEKITKNSLYTGFRVLLSYLGKYRRSIIILSLLGIISAIGNAVIPYIAGRFFDSILNPDAVNLFGFSLPLFAAILILWAVIQSITYTIDWRSNTMSEYVSNTIWLDYFSNAYSSLLELPMSFHKKYKIGDVGNKINVAANALETIVGSIVIDLSPQILSIVIALGIAFWIKPLFALVLVVGLFVYITALVLKVAPLGGYQRKYRKHISELWGDAYDAAANTLAVKQATTEAYERFKLSKRVKIAIPLYLRMTKVWSGLTLWQRITILTTQILIFVIAVFYIRAGTMTLGELIAFNAYAAMIFGPFVTIARNWQTIQNGLINVEEMEKILKLPTENYEPKDSTPFELKGDFVFRDVSFEYTEGKSILQGVSLTVSAGDVVALVGESGVGKSTLVDLVSGYHFPTTGSIQVDGHDIRNINLRSYRSQIAVVPQEVVLFNDTIQTNIKYGNFKASDEEMKEAARKAHALEFIEKFTHTWDQVVGERGVKLSVGQKQRVAIARAILRNPKILILDEPTSALDAGTEKIITESLDELMKGRTTFIVAHRFSTVRKADKIFVFKEGKIIESGKHAELMKIRDGEYKRLHDLQIGLHE